MNLSGVALQDRLYNKMVAPEATYGDQFDRTFDIYQLGLTLYRVCVGDAAFSAQYASYGTGASFDRAEFRFDLRKGRFPNRKALPPHTPTKLRHIINKCIATKIADRYQSAIDVANALAGVDGATLDWRLSTTADMRKWSKNERGTLYEFTVNNSGESRCYKTVPNGLPRKVSAGCKMYMSDEDIEKFLGSY